VKAGDARGGMLCFGERSGRVGGGINALHPPDDVGVRGPFIGVLEQEGKAVSPGRHARGEVDPTNPPFSRNEERSALWVECRGALHRKGQCLGEGRKRCRIAIDHELAKLPATITHQVGERVDELGIA